VGFGAGVLGAVLVTWLQSRLDWDRAIVDYDRWLDLGVRMGAGAMLGDSVKSFFKRRRRVAPGGTWIPFDQLDFVLGALVLVWPRVALAWSDVAIVVALSFAGHIVVNHIGYWLGVRDAKW
jgi:CDP-2,3-bis-(O-geranylgeranyl)-sn-glycerol synthase